jgi:hypothetical protein
MALALAGNRLAGLREQGKRTTASFRMAPHFLPFHLPLFWEYRWAPFRHRWRRGAAVGLPDALGRHRLQAAGRPLPVWSSGYLDKVQVPCRARGGDRRLHHHKRGLPLADRGREPRRQVGRSRPDRDRVWPGKLARILPKLQALETAKCPFSGKTSPRKLGKVHWVQPELVAEIEYEGFTADGLLRQAAFKALREDKPAREVETVEPAPATTRAQGTGANHLTHPRHPRQWLSRGDGCHALSCRQGAVTRRERWATRHQTRSRSLLRAVRDWLIQHIRGRPCSIIRVPDNRRRGTVLSKTHRQGPVEPDHLGDGVGRPQTIPTVRQGGGANCCRPGCRVGAAPLELSAVRTRAAWPPGF